MAAAEAEDTPHFHPLLTRESLERWLNENPGREDVKDIHGQAPLLVAARAGLSDLVARLMDVQGVNVNCEAPDCRTTPLHAAATADIVRKLLTGGANPIAGRCDGGTPLMSHVYCRRAEQVETLLQDARVLATIKSTRDNYCYNPRNGPCTALHLACSLGHTVNEGIVEMLVGAGADPTRSVGEEEHWTPLDLLRFEGPSCLTAIGLMEELISDSQRASILVKARRLVMAGSPAVATPSFLRGRVARGEPLPHVTLSALLVSNEEGVGDSQFNKALAFVTGMGGGPEGGGMPRDVFRVVVDMLMPRWDPQRKLPGSGGSAASQQGEEEEGKEEGVKGSGGSSMTRCKITTKRSGAGPGKGGRKQGRH